MAKKTIATIVAENAEALKELTTTKELREWAIRQGFDNRSAFPKFKAALETIGLSYYGIKSETIAVTQPVPAEKELTHIEKIAKEIGGKYWEKGDKRRIYVSGGNNYHYDGKWYVDFKEDGSWTVECWLNEGYSNKNAKDYIAKYKDIIAADVEAAEITLGIKVEPAQGGALAALSINEDFEKQLQQTPVEIIHNEHYNPRLTDVKRVANLADTTMIDFYHGRGKGIAYVKENKYVIAFQYGRERYANEPKDCEKIIVEFSCTQICFTF